MISYAQNGEDVVLWRALGSLSAGRYVEVGANHPRDDSVTRAFYDRGWSGITIEPVPYFADLHRAERPRDTIVEAVITNWSSLADILEQCGVIDHDIHFMLVDTDGSEPELLAGVDLGSTRPWVLVIKSTAPNSTMTTHSEWEPQLLAQGYEYCLFDGVSRFYVAAEKADLLRAPLSYPACVLDNYQTLSHATALRESRELLEQAADCRATAMRERRELLQQTAHWRTIALTGWADAVNQAPGTPRGAGVDAECDRARRQLVAMQSTLSWRITRPLRGARRVIDLARGR